MPVLLSVLTHENLVRFFGAILSTLGILKIVLPELRKIIREFRKTFEEMRGP